MQSEAVKEKVLKILKEVQDPELKRSIVARGMLKDVQIEGEQVFIHLEVASRSPAYRDQLKQECHSAVRHLEGVSEVTVQLATAVKPGAAFSPKLPLPGIRHVIAVASGKGGVGKTTVAVNLALALAESGLKIGLMDGDVYGPNVPLMLGVDPAARPHVNPENKIIPIQVKNLKMISMGVLVPPDQPMVWRGPMLHSTVTQFLQKVDWGELDILLVDLPPGTGDVQLSLVQSVPVSGAVIVTTPQEVALMDVRKGIMMFQKTEVPILGVVENMSGDIFGRGGGEAAAKQFEVPFLGSVPLEGAVRQGGDSGVPVVVSQKDGEAARAIFKAASLLADQLKGAGVS